MKPPVVNVLGERSMQTHQTKTKLIRFRIFENEIE